MPNFHSTYFSKYILRFFYCVSICLPFLLSSCENCTFVSDNVQFAAVSFYDAEGNIKTKEFAEIRGVFARTNDAMPTPLVEGEDAQGRIFELPIFTRADTTIFVFTQYITTNNVQDTIQDTLAIRYKVVVEVLPPDCGYDEAITDLEVVYTTFADAEVLKKELKELELQNPIPHIKIIDN